MKGGKKIRECAIGILISLLFAVIIASTVQAADPSNAVASDNLSMISNQASSTFSPALPDPRVIRGGNAVYNSTTIQDAINHAQDNDTIEVDAGTYNENVIVNKKLDITATGTATVNSFRIDPSGSGSIIQGFTINNPTGHGIDINNANNTQILRRSSPNDSSFIQY